MSSVGCAPTWATEPPVQLDLESGTICRRTSDSRTCHTAVSGSHWRHFYLNSKTKAQCECSFNCTLVPGILKLVCQIQCVKSSIFNKPLRSKMSGFRHPFTNLYPATVTLCMHATSWWLIVDWSVLIREPNGTYRYLQQMWNFSDKNTVLYIDRNIHKN